jgi:hypothetical protein
MEEGLALVGANGRMERIRGPDRIFCDGKG